MLTNGPELWDKILAATPAGAVVAGGAVRDFLLGLPCKDIDVFVTANVETWKPLTDPDFVLQQAPENRKEEYEGKSWLVVMDDYEHGDTPVQVIGVDIPAGPTFGARLVASFDFGLTRYWYDGEIHDTPEAASDRHHSTLTDLLGTRPERAVMRAERFMSRHPGRFTFVPYQPGKWETITKHVHRCLPRKRKFA